MTVRYHRHYSVDIQVERRMANVRGEADGAFNAGDFEKRVRAVVGVMIAMLNQ